MLLSRAAVIDEIVPGFTFSNGKITSTFMRKIRLSPNLLCAGMALLMLLWHTHPVSAQAIQPLSGQRLHAVVGNGTAASCTETALGTALAQGGDITFDCGSATHTIKFTFYKQITQATSIDGGGLIILSGNQSTPLFQVFFSASLSLSNIEIADGLGRDGFGGIDNFGQLILNNVSVSNNNANTFNGGGITNHGNVEISDSVFFNNVVTSTRNGGAIYSEGGSVILTRTQILSNTAGNGGGIHIAGGTFDANNLIVHQNKGFDGGGILVNQNVTATIEQSEFSANTANYGGGLEISGKLVMTNTTISGNNAANDGGGIWFLNASDVSQLHSLTFFGNQANLGAALNLNGSAAVMKNSALVGSGSVSSALCAGGVISADVTNYAGDGTCGTATISNDIRLLALADNGGFAKSHMPSIKSALIDAVDNCPPVDQRDVSRPRGDRCDVGAVEYVPDTTLYLPTSMSSYIPPFTGRAELEPNNAIATANGLLQSGVPCIGFPDDLNDYFSFTTTAAGQVSVSLTGHLGTNTNNLQMQLRNANDQLIVFVFKAPFNINVANLPAGTYYVRLFYAAPGPYSSNAPYTLQVVYP